MQGINPPTPAQLLAAGQLPLAKFELYFPDNCLGTLNFDSGSVEPQVNEILTDATSGATAKVFSVTVISATWGAGTATGSIELRDCSGCFNDNANINGSIGGANMLTVNHPDGTVGVDKLVKNGAFVHDVDPPNDWTVENCTLASVGGGQVGNCLEITRTGANFQSARQNITLTVGKTYKFSAYVKSGTSGDEAFRLIIYNLVGANIVAQIMGASSGAWVLYSVTFEATEASIRLYLRKNTATAGTMLFDEVTLYELDEWINLCDLDSKNYVEDWSISLGGASPTPNPVGGTWSATLFNEDSIFHPQHPTSAYNGYCVTGRKVRISIGGKYGGTDYYWPRLIGYMDEPKFSIPDYRVSISGQDYMKHLEDAEFQELDATYPNHWGLSTTFDSWPSDGMIGGELYVEGDAMDIAADANNIGGWGTNLCTFVSYDAGAGDPAQPSTWVGRLTASVGAASYIEDMDVADVTINHRYKVTFQHRAVGVAADTEKILVRIYQGGVPIKTNTYYSSDTWTESTIFFTATATAVVGMRINCPPTIADLRLDLFSIQRYVRYEDRWYQLPGGSNGPYHVTLDGNPVWENDEDEGWLYEEATGRVSFVKGKTVADGTGPPGLGNVEIFYYTDTDPEDAVARILYFAKVCDPATGVPYVNEAAALAAMDNDDPAFAIERVWFKAGSTFLSAIRMLCEVCDYRFYFKYNGQPAFKAVPAPGGADFTFTSPAHIASINTYQSRSEIKNRVIIKGIKQTDVGVGSEEGAPSELKGEAADDAAGASIDTYGERTLTITNYLFQHQARLNQMCIDLLARYKNPKWYSDLEIPFNFVPLELVDDIQWEERLSHILDVTQTGAIRDIKINKFDTTYKVEKP